MKSMQVLGAVREDDISVLCTGEMGARSVHEGVEGDETDGVGRDSY